MTKIYLLDNEALIELKTSTIKKKKYQLAPPYIHHINAAKRSIRNCKDNFIWIRKY